MQQILAVDIGTRVHIIGRLGCPLGEVVTVRVEFVGEEIQPGGLLPKDTLRYFQVTEVNGKRLTTPVRFAERDFSLAGGDIEPLSPRKGMVWEVRGAELGQYRGMPPALGRELHSKVPAQRAYTFGFYTYFEYASYRALK
jgi:hypothetical protein